MIPPLRRLILSALLASAAGAQTQRGVNVPARPVANSGNGAYYALVIGVNQYPNWPPLQTAVGDAQAVDLLLRQRFGFQTRLLTDAQATRANILNAFADYRRRLHDNDNLLIYYAGHGARDGGQAYWLPVDSDPNSSANWIIAGELTKDMSVIPARHILVISDSCYSGGLSRDATPNTAPAERNNYLQTMLNNKSRVLISSGRDEPVADGGGGGHSVFANAILKGLRGMTDSMFTANDLFSSYVLQAVAGGSAQVPLFEVIQNSGHEFGDFVFIPRTRAGAASGAADSVRPSEMRAPAPGPGGATVPHVSNTRLAADGRAINAAPAVAGGYLPLTNYRVALLEFHDFPEDMTDAYLTTIAKWQVNGEQSNWKLLDSWIAGKPLFGTVPAGLQLNPQHPQFFFEWQKIIDSNPALAQSLLGLFLRSDGDWSFLKKQPGWDERFDAYITVFLFAREKIEGRQPDFVARELTGVVRKHLQMAVAQAPVKLYFDIRLQSGYDIPQAAIRLMKPNSNEFADGLEILRRTENVTFSDTPVDKLPAPTDRDYRSYLPGAARSAVNYNVSQELTDTPEARPGVNVYGADPLEIWRKAMPGESFDNRMPPLGGFAFDRQLKLGPIPFDPRKAEPMLQALRSLRARVFFTANRVNLSRVSYERQWKPLEAWISAHVDKVEILGPTDEALVTIPGSTLPAAAH